jgi:YfiH family protein
MKLYSDERLLSLGFINGTTTKEFGDMRPYAPRRELYSALCLPPDRMLAFKQVHGTEILEVNDENDFQKIKKAEAVFKEPAADGWILRMPGAGVSVITADCMPLFLWDKKGSAAGLAHCGWRAIAGGLAEKMVAQMGAAPAEITAYAGPHIKDCCFEIQSDIAHNFAKTSIKEKDGKMFADLTAETRARLLAAGLRPENTFSGGCQCACTCCNTESFFSYRRDKTREALLSFIFKL